MEKRICTLLLTLCLTFTGILLTSCTESASEVTPETTLAPPPDTIPETTPKTTAEELLRTASEKFAALESYAAVKTTATSATMAETTFDMVETMDLKINRATPVPTAFLRSESSDSTGRLIWIDQYYDTDWVYRETHETNVNSATQYRYKQDTSGSNHEFGFRDVLQALPAELIADVKPMKNGDGSHTVSLTVPADAFVQIYSELAEEFSIMDEAKAGDAKVEIVVTKEGYYKEYKINFAVTGTVDGENALLSVTVEIVFDNPGAPVEVTLPEGYEAFPTAQVRPD
ncbi:MAG: hypothetical protein E7654_06470 [Ruminococcaceae bacterium]|nr:hypothetical protein [Oscillospiraceae bacterium]